MKSFMNCPSCGRFITIENIEAPCQLCAKDTCSRCLHTCTKCGKEVCQEHFNGNICASCNSETWVREGWDVIRNEKGNDTDLNFAVGKILVGGVWTVLKKTSLMNEKSNRKREQENAIRRLTGRRD